MRRFIEESYRGRELEVREVPEVEEGARVRGCPSYTITGLAGDCD